MIVPQIYYILLFNIATILNIENELYNFWKAEY